MKPNALCVFSGGADSTVLLYKILKDYYVQGITFDYGQKHRKEIECARNIATINKVPLKVIDLSFFKDITKGACSLTDESIDIQTITETLGDPQPKQYVPNRNMMMLSIAASYAEAISADKIFYGAGGDDEHSGYWDCTRDFRSSMNAVLAQNRRNHIEICSPLVEMTKGEIISLGVSLKVPYLLTWTCYQGGEKACGVCPTCANRLKGFIDAGYIDPLPYEKDIPWEKYNCKPLPY